MISNEELNMLNISNNIIKIHKQENNLLNGISHEIQRIMKNIHVIHHNEPKPKVMCI